MKNKVLFWGTFLIFLGLFILMYNFGIYNFALGEIVSWWPVLLVLWGTALLKLPEIIKNIIAALSGVLMALLIVTMFTGGVSILDSLKTKIEFSDKVPSKCQNYEEAVNPEIKLGKLNFEIGAGKVSIGSTPDYFYFIESGLDNCEVVIDRPDNSTAVINYSFGEHFENVTNSLDRFTSFLINENLPWDINISAGATKMELNLSKVYLTELNIDAGATDAEIYFGDKNPLTKVNIECGAAKFIIHIPKQLGCSVQGDMALTKTQFDDLQKNSAGVYVSENYYKSTNKIDFVIDGALSKIQIIRD